MSTPNQPPSTQYDSQTGRAAALRRWAMEPDPAAATEKARGAFMRRFERQADPDGVMPPAERARRAEMLMRAHMIGLARKRKIKRATEQLRKRAV